MLERLLKIKVPLAVALANISNPPEALLPSEWETIKECVPLLKPMEDMTTELSGELYPTLSMVIPMLRGLQYTISSKEPGTLDGMMLKTALLNSITKRFLDLEKSAIPQKACFLDPRFKKAGFGLEANAKQAENQVLSELQSLLSKKKTSTAPIPRITASKSSIWDILDAKIELCKGTETTSSSSMILLRQYKELLHLSRQQNPMEFWSLLSTLPELAQLARKYLCIPATSVPSERQFSKAGLITNDRRNRLKPKNLDMLLFLNSCL
ncbi:hypothetical protein JTE90_004176 [Oedothorax gibbosus]|uniref:HAT C-terminal dimerisation domain-containing protein n=1 Tax=Oedothorax gibbosus TaxID=931172 RepID=A0AAV6TUS9_9ARAC|nr:hypothetical protein JTE90_004176 [Oedothorax gibbosus]